MAVCIIMPAGLSRTTFEAKDLDFEKHVFDDHDFGQYVAFKMHLARPRALRLPRQRAGRGACCALHVVVAHATSRTVHASSCTLGADD